MIRTRRHHTVWSRGISTVAAIGMLAVCGTRLLAGDLHQLDTSLKFVPADAAFYTSMYNAKELVARVEKSQAWADVVETPLFQDLIRTYENGDETSDELFDDDVAEGLAQVKSFLENPQTRIALATLGDMFGEDVFMMAGDDFTGTIELAQHIQNEMNTGVLQSATSDAYDEYSEEELRAALLLATIDAHLELVETPQILIGFKVEDTDRAQLQVNTLTGLLALACMADARLGHALGEAKVGDARFVTFTLKGEMLPWEEMPVDELEEIEIEAGQAARVIEKARELQVCIAVGILDGYLLLSIDDTADHLQTLGQGDLLIDRPELAPLADYTDQTLLGVDYVSRDFMARVGTGEADIDRLEAMVMQMVAASGDIDDQTRAELEQDIPAVTGLVKSLLPEPAATFGFAFLSDEGIEEYYYTYSDLTGGDANRPLTILSHVGGDPVMLAATSIDMSTEDYENLADLVRMGLKYFDLLVPPELSEKELEKYTRFKTGVTPLLERLDSTNRELLVPSLEDGQMAVVVDNQLESTQFCPGMPELETPLPMFEPALVLLLNDTEPLKKTTKVYIDTVNEAIELLREIEPDEVPEEVAVPEGEVVEAKEGSLLVFELPAELELDEQIQPNAAASDTTAALSLSVGHSTRILRQTPLTLGGVLKETEQPMAGAIALDFAAMVDTASAWIHWAMEENMDDTVDIAGREYTREEMIDQVDALLRFVQTMKSVTVCVTVEDGVTVSHQLTRFEDVK